eukprot:8056175-Lingulodinium_polyedra.AAC.1
MTPPGRGVARRRVEAEEDRASVQDAARVLVLEGGHVFEVNKRHPGAGSQQGEPGVLAPYQPPDRLVHQRG